MRDRTRKKAPGLVAILVAVVEFALNYYPPTRAILDQARAAGGLGGMTADTLTHPAFAFVILLFGIWWVFLKGEGSDDVEGNEQASAVAPVGPVLNPIFSNNPTFNNIINVPKVDDAPEPKLVFDSSRVVRAFIGPVHLRAPKADFVEVGFLNEPYAETRRRPTAVGVVAHITFLNGDGSRELFGPMPYGRWAHVPEPQHERFLDVASRTDVPADGVPKVLNLAIKLVGDEDAYGFSNYNIVAGNVWRLPEFKLVPGSYKVRVRLLGENVDQLFWFDVVNSGDKDGPLQVCHHPEGASLPSDRPRDRTQDWENLLAKFEALRTNAIHMSHELRDSGTQVAAQRPDRAGATWIIESTDRGCRVDAENYCALAGRLLRVSGVWGTLPAFIRDTADDKDRWLTFLQSIGEGVSPEMRSHLTSVAAGIQTETWFDEISDVPVASKRGCAVCLRWEIRPS
jgi:hypothetical protein